MPLRKMLTAVGNSYCVILDKPILRLLGWDENTWIVMSVEGEKIIARKATEEEAREAEAEHMASGVDGGRVEQHGSVEPSKP